MKTFQSVALDAQYYLGLRCIGAWILAGGLSMQEWLLGALLILAVAWLLLKLRQNKADVAAESNPARKKDTGAYHAVSIKYSESACAAAKEMTGRRFLSSAAPRLPLPDCDSLECRCAFLHHNDRRKGRDRRSPFAPSGFAGASGSYEQERRERVDRRKSD